MQKTSLRQACDQANSAVSHKSPDLQYPAGTLHAADHFKESSLQVTAEHMRLGMMCMGVFGDLLQKGWLGGREPFCIGLRQWVDNVHIKRFRKDIRKTVITSKNSAAAGAAGKTPAHVRPPGLPYQPPSAGLNCGGIYSHASVTWCSSSSPAGLPSSQRQPG